MKIVPSIAQVWKKIEGQTIIVDYERVCKYDYTYIREMNEYIEWEFGKYVPNQWFINVDKDFVREMIENEAFMERFFKSEQTSKAVENEGVIRIVRWNNWPKIVPFKEIWDKYWSDKDLDQIEALENYILKN